MANTIQIKHGSTIPTTDNLSSYELGYVHNGNLYIRETIKDNSGVTTSDKIVQLTGLAATGLVNSENQLKLPAISSTTSNTGRILVVDNTGIVYYKTPTNIRSEIGAFSTSGGTIKGNATITGTITTQGNATIAGTITTQGNATFNNSLTINGSLLANGAIILKENVNYGYKNPNDAKITGIKGQIYFLLPEK